MKTFKDERDEAAKNHANGAAFVNGANWALRSTVVKEMAEALRQTQSYLEWNADLLSGDDLVGDGRLTARYNRQLSDIEKALAAYEQAVKEGK